MQPNLGQMAQVTDKSPSNRKSVAVSACGLRVWRTDATAQWFAGPADALRTRDKETKTKREMAKGPSTRSTVIGGSGTGDKPLGTRTLNKLRPVCFGV